MTYVTPELTLIGSATGIVLGSFINDTDSKLGYASNRHNVSSVSEW